MIIFYDKVNEKGIARVTTIHNAPQELTEEKLALGFEVEEVPEPDMELAKNKQVSLYCKPETKEVWVEYEERQLTEEEKLRIEMEELKAQMAQIMAAINK